MAAELGDQLWEFPVHDVARMLSPKTLKPGQSRQEPYHPSARSGAASTTMLFWKHCAQCPHRLRFNWYQTRSRTTLPLPTSSTHALQIAMQLTISCGTSCRLPSTQTANSPNVQIGGGLPLSSPLSAGRPRMASSMLLRSSQTLLQDWVCLMVWARLGQLATGRCRQTLPQGRWRSVSPWKSRTTGTRL